MKDERQRFKGICPICGTELWICKSMAMSIGVNHGHGSCLKCNTFLSLTFNKERQEFDTEPWTDYITRVCNSCAELQGEGPEADNGEDHDCGCCQREDAPCEYCIRDPQNMEKKDPDLKDYYYHEKEN